MREGIPKRKSPAHAVIVVLVVLLAFGAAPA
jgi:hypothetical protein